MEWMLMILHHLRLHYIGLLKKARLRPFQPCWTWELIHSTQYSAFLFDSHFDHLNELLYEFWTLATVNFSIFLIEIILLVTKKNINCPFLKNMKGLAKNRFGFEWISKTTSTLLKTNYRISSYSFLPWIVSAHLYTVTSGLMYCDLWISKFKKE